MCGSGRAHGGRCPNKTISTKSTAQLTHTGRDNISGGLESNHPQLSFSLTEKSFNNDYFICCRFFSFTFMSISFEANLYASALLKADIHLLILIRPSRVIGLEPVPVSRESTLDRWPVQCSALTNTHIPTSTGNFI